MTKTQALDAYAESLTDKFLKSTKQDGARPT